MKDYEDEAFDELGKAQQRKVAHGVTDGSLWRKRHKPDEILAMARHAGFERLGHVDNDWVCFPKDIENFAKLIAEREREACAKVCEKHAEVYASLPKTLTTDASWAACIDSRDAIRARGEKA